jgi:hypothetical protein
MITSVGILNSNRLQFLILDLHFIILNSSSVNVDMDHFLGCIGEAIA